MPYVILRDTAGGFRVKNAVTGTVHSFHTTLAKAKSQVKLLNAIEHGYMPKKRR